jgi:signal transduction histidine kinase
MRARQREILREQRAQIARELHDIVAHSVSVILLQVGAARVRALGQPDITQPLHAAEEGGRQALAELRRLLGVLNDAPAERRDGDHDAAERMPDAPQPSIAALDQLAAAVRAAGLDIDLAIVGEVRPLPAGLELSVYRIVQEALTNVLKHAQASMARVRVDYGPDAVTIDVTDDGTARTASAPPGHGLVGMRQRAQVFGGTTTAGPAPGGGWHVRAEVPAEPAPDEATV